MSKDPREVLSSTLSLWWLRPENGLAVASYILRGVDFAPRPGQKAADFACGDGVNTFLKCGGRFDPAFDLFSAGVRRESAQQIVSEAIDVFDHDDASYAPRIAARPAVKFAYGTDHKARLLDKAARLGFYDQLIESDLAQDPALPDASLDIAYCNSLYWTEATAEAVAIIFRKLKPGAMAVFDVMTEGRKHLHFQNLLPTLPAAWQALLNRGRDVNNPGIRSAKGWRELFAAHGRVEEERDIFPAAIAHAWNFGLRPIFPVLNRMAGSLAADTRGEVKREWVAVWTDLLLPLLVEPEKFPNDGAQVRLQFVVRKA